MLRVLAVVALLVLAGCAGTLGEQRSGQVTPAPVPTADPSLVTVPETNGSVDIDAVIERHDAALANRSFTRSVERAGPQNTRSVWVDGEADIVRVQRILGPLVEDAIVTDGTVYRAVDGYSSIDYRTEPSNGTVPYVSALSGSDELQQVVVDEGYRRVDTVERDGRPLAVVAVNTTGQGSAPSTAVQSTLYVDSEGIIREVDHWERRPGGTVVEFSMSVETGTGDVPIPWWAEDAGIYG